ncbi:O-methyltransferase involved in polyketide biosynthesis [Mycolicibacterium senegalense]|nr:O-methyltransferase involved in polyketide biosynthesis [Mycolicibacterium senegalense]
MTDSPVKVSGDALTGVSETALMTLQVRAHEARRPDGLIDDPMAVHLVDSIDFDFAKFGYTRRQDMALRALLFDRMTSDYLRSHPKATVVALAEGLQTSFYRLDAAGLGHEFRWLSVDLEPMIEFRNKLLPKPDRVAAGSSTPCCAHSICRSSTRSARWWGCWSSGSCPPDQALDPASSARAVSNRRLGSVTGPLRSVWASSV